MAQQVSTAALCVAAEHRTVDRPVTGQRARSHVLFLSQVFMLDTQCSPKTPNNKEGFEHAQSCVLIIELPSDHQSNGHAQKRWKFFVYF